MKNKAQWITTMVFFLVVVVVSLVAFWLLKETAYFWITYLFTLLAGSVLFVVLLYYLNDGKRTMREFPANAPYAYIALQYGAIEIGMAAVFCVIGITGLSTAYFICAEILLALVYGVRMVAAFGAKQAVLHPERAAKIKTANWQMVAADVQAMQGKAGAMPSGIRTEIEKALQKLYDAVRYSDPMSEESVAVIERQIREKIASVGLKLERLATGEDADASAALAEMDAIERFVEERNNRIKINK